MIDFNKAREDFKEYMRKCHVDIEPLLDRAGKLLSPKPRSTQYLSDEELMKLVEEDNRVLMKEGFKKCLDQSKQLLDQQKRKNND